jgi:hypothetical protein
MSLAEAREARPGKRIWCNINVSDYALPPPDCGGESSMPFRRRGGRS